MKSLFPVSTWGMPPLEPLTPAGILDVSWLSHTKPPPPQQQQQQQEEGQNPESLLEFYSDHNQQHPKRRPARSEPHATRQQQRLLDVDNGDSYLVDADGEEYEPYSLAWRYLGMFIDCDDNNNNNDNNDDDNNEDQERRRHLSQDDQQSDSGCRRKVLWAAVRSRPSSVGCG